MRKHLSTIILFVLLLIGMSLLLYPTVANWWNQFHSNRSVYAYTEALSTIDPAVFEELREQAREYNDALWTFENRFIPSEEEHEWYESTLKLEGSEVMSVIKVPRVGISIPIYHGADEAVLQVAVGHIEGSSLPIGGQGTHCVLSGHRGLPSARLFTDLDQVVEGDIFLLQTLDETLTYEVDQIRIVLPDEMNDLALEPGKDYCTLVTCTPYGINSHRMLVRGHRIDNLEVEGEIQVTADATLFAPLMVAPGVAAPILLVLLIVLMVRGRKKKPKDKAEKAEEKKSKKDKKKKK